MKPSAPNSPTPSKPPLTSVFPLVGKPWQRIFPTPRTEDYIVSVRKDTRLADFKMPRKGSQFKGIDEKGYIREGFKFAKALPIEDKPGFVDLYYLRPFKDQNSFNWTIAYPYVNKHYPQITRTYYCLRSDYAVIQEPDADTTDPASPDLFLTDHKIERFDNDPVLDSVFVKVVRVFERLPSPNITSYDTNQFQQPITIVTQEVETSTQPHIDALTENSKQERTGTAKAKNINARVAEVFPQTVLKREIPSMTRELWLGGFQETNEVEVTAANHVDPPSITPGVYSITGERLTEFKIKTTTQTLPLPQVRNHKELGAENFGGGVLDETITIDSPTSGLSIDQGTWVVESKLRNLKEFGFIKRTVSVDPAEWPTLHEEKVFSEGIYAGIKVIIDKKFVPAGNNPDGTGPSIAPYTGQFTPNPNSGCPPGGPITDLMPHDRWRTIQITSRIDLSTLPSPVTYAGMHPLDIPPTLLSIFAICGAHGGGSQAVSNDGNDGEGVSVAVESGALGTIGYNSLGGFRGNAMAQITRLFLEGPPELSADGLGIVIDGIEYVPFQFLGANGTASLVSIYARFTGAISGPVGGPGSGTGGSSSSSNTGQVRTQTTEFRPMLTGQFLNPPAGAPAPVYMIDALTGGIIDGNVFTAPTSTQGATTSDGQYSLELIGPLPAPTSRLITNIPQSTPLYSPNAGDKILAAIQVAEWRFNIWVVHLVNAIMPQLATGIFSQP